MRKTFANLTIKNKGISVIEIISFLVFLISIFGIVNSNATIAMISMALIIVSGFLIIRASKRLFDRKPKIVMNNKGIHLKFLGMFYPWSAINDVFIHRHVEGFRKKTKKVTYLHIFIYGTERIYKVDKFLIDQKLFNNTASYFVHSYSEQLPQVS